MRTGLRIEGSRPDGVLLVNLGDRQMVLVNVVDHVKTAVLSERQADGFGPWTRFDGDVKPDASVRTLMQQVVDQPGNIVPATAVGALDYDHRDVQNLAGPTRQEFAEMLSQANMDAGAELPQTQNFADDPGFLQHCLQEIVPGLTAAGIEVSDPNSFCSLMHLERTGIMPRGIAAVVVAQPQAPPAMAAPAAMASPTPAPMPGANAGFQAAEPVAMSDDKVTDEPPTDEDGDGKVNAAVAVEPSTETATELEGDEPDDEYTGSPEESEMVAEMVAKIDEALDAAESLVIGLLDKLGIPDPDEAGEVEKDKSKKLTARLNAIRNYGMPKAPNDAGLPADLPPAPLSAQPHGVPGGQLGVAAADPNLAPPMTVSAAAGAPIPMTPSIDRKSVV